MTENTFRCTKYKICADRGPHCFLIKKASTIETGLFSRMPGVCDKKTEEIREGNGAIIFRILFETIIDNEQGVNPDLLVAKVFPKLEAGEVKH
jgi:hypothetical protein